MSSIFDPLHLLQHKKILFHRQSKESLIIHNNLKTTKPLSVKESLMCIYDILLKDEHKAIILLFMVGHGCKILWNCNILVVLPW